MTNLILTVLCTITLGMESSAVQDTTVYYMIDGKVERKFDGSQLNGKTIVSYRIGMAKDMQGNVEKVHFIKTTGAPKQKEETRYYVDNQQVPEVDYKKINNADIKQVMVYKAGSEPAMTLTGSSQVTVISVTLKEEALSKKPEELDEVLVVSYGSNNDPVSTYKTSESVVSIDQVEEKPKFQGRDARSFFHWVTTVMTYPESAKAAGVQGRVVVSFKVNSDGKVSDVNVLRGVCDVLDREAVRVISSSPDWTPGRHKGKNVAVTYTFPVIFMLK